MPPPATPAPLPRVARGPPGGIAASGRVATQQSPEARLTSGLLKTAREMNWGVLFERSILGHDGDRCLTPVDPPVQTSAENIVLETDLAWIQEGPTVGRTDIRRIEELRPNVVDIEELALQRPAIAERILVARTDRPTRERLFVVRRNSG
jgi:hypothetical protein